MVWAAQTAWFHPPCAILRSDKTIFSGDSRIAENIRVPNRIYPDQTARHHKQAVVGAETAVCV
jgi:hypothetical protein